MINKFQQGGAAPQQQGGILAQIQSLPQDQLKLIMTAFAQWAQLKGVDIQQLQSNPAALEQALGLFMQEIQAQQAQMARQGAKLNYIKKISHKCADDEELVYYKVGGKMGCGCEKKAQGGKAPEKKLSAINQFKSNHAKGPGSTKQPMLDVMKKQNSKFKNDYSSKRIKDSEKDYLEGKADHKVKGDKCGGKMKKHQFGGTLEQLKKQLGL